MENTLKITTQDILMDFKRRYSEYMTTLAQTYSAIFGSYQPLWSEFYPVVKRYPRDYLVNIVEENTVEQEDDDTANQYVGDPHVLQSLITEIVNDIRDMKADEIRLTRTYNLVNLLEYGLMSLVDFTSKWENNSSYMKFNKEKVQRLFFSDIGRENMRHLMIDGVYVLSYNNKFFGTSHENPVYLFTHADNYKEFGLDLWDKRRVMWQQVVLTYLWLNGHIENKQTEATLRNVAYSMSRRVYDDHSRRIQELDRQLKGLLASFRLTVRQKIEAEQVVNMSKLTDERSNVDKYLQILSDELDAIRSNKFVRYADFTSDKLVVHLEGLQLRIPVYREDTIKVPLGAVTIVMSQFGLGEDVRFYSTRGDRYSGYLDSNSWHPHVYSDNRVCLGGYVTVIQEIIKSKSLVDLVSAYIRFLQTVNTEDVAGRQVIMETDLNREYSVCQGCGLLFRDELQYSECPECSCQYKSCVTDTGRYLDGTRFDRREAPNPCVGCNDDYLDHGYTDEDMVYSEYHDAYLCPDCRTECGDDWVLNCSDDFFACQECSSVTHEDDAYEYYFFNLSGDRVTDSVCARCFDDMVEGDRIVRVYSDRNSYGYYRNDGFLDERGIYQCHVCDKWILNTTWSFIDGDVNERVCEECVENEYFNVCEDCDVATHEDRCTDCDAWINPCEDEPDPEDEEDEEPMEMEEH